jgi:hypothetical protein
MNTDENTDPNRASAPWALAPRAGIKVYADSFGGVTIEEMDPLRPETAISIRVEDVAAVCRAIREAAKTARRNRGHVDGR